MKTGRVPQGVRGSLIRPHLSWGAHPPMRRENKIQRHGSADRGKRDWKRELRNSSHPVHLFSGTRFSSSWMTILKPLSSHPVLFQEGALKYPEKSKHGESCAEAAPSLIWKEKGPSSSLKGTSELEQTPGLPLALPTSVQLRPGRNVSLEWR